MNWTKVFEFGSNVPNLPELGQKCLLFCNGAFWTEGFLQGTTTEIGKDGHKVSLSWSVANNIYENGTLFGNLRVTHFLIVTFP